MRLGKKRSSFGKWLDKNRITQEEIRSLSKVNKNTITRICSDPDYIPAGKTMIKLIKALRKQGYNVDIDDFWGL